MGTGLSEKGLVSWITTAPGVAHFECRGDVVMNHKLAHGIRTRWNNCYATWVSEVACLKPRMIGAVINTEAFKKTYDTGQWETAGKPPALQVLANELEQYLIWLGASVA